MSGRSLCWCCLFFTWISLSSGIRLYPCGGDGYPDVEENTAITFHCDQYTGEVTWRYRSPVNLAPTAIALCTNTSCTSSTVWTVTYISAGNSSVTTKHTSRIQAGAQYLCAGHKCELHIIVSAEVSQPTTTMTRQDSEYTLSVSAGITQVYSSRGLYSCIGQLGSSRQTTQPDLTPPASDVTNTANRAGKCDVTMPLPVTSGTYPCSVTVTPGNTQRSCGSITITRPPPPAISCPSDLIAENTPFTCTCDTSDMGQPGGRLRWYTGTGSNVNTEVISGNYGTNTLAMTRTVTRNDNNVRKFRCVNNWTVNVTAQSCYTARVAYGPIINVQPRGDNQCTMTPDKTSCHVTEGQAVHLLCDADSNPAPENCTWAFLSGSGKILGSALDLGSVNRSDSGVYQVRVATTKPVSDDRLPLTARRNLTVLVTYQTTDTTLTVNGRTNVTVNETETVTLKCQSRGRPTPRLQLLQRNSQLAQKNGGQLSLSAEMTHLSHDVRTQCNNTGTLTCRADNGVGSDQPISVQLYVNCKPRKTTAVLEPPKLNFISQPVSAAFSLEAFPLPDHFTFQYLGSTQSSNNGQPVSSNKIELTAGCTNTHADYAVSCNVSVVSARDSTAEGFYTFTAANAFGQEQFVFQVTVNATADRTTDRGINAAAIGGGIGAALVVIGIVALVYYCCCIRRKRSGVQRNRDSRKERGQGAQSASSTAGVYELMEDGSPRQATDNQPPYVNTSLQTSAIGVRSVHSPLTPYQNDGAEDNQPPSVYTSLQTSDIGVRSLYSGLTPYQNLGADLRQDNQPPSVYTSLQTSDIGVRSLYSGLTPYQNLGADLRQDPVYENSEAEKRAVYVNLPVKP